METQQQHEQKSIKENTLNPFSFKGRVRRTTYWITYTICNFIKNSLIKEMYDYCYPLYDEYIKERYCLLLGKLCKYKEAYLYLLETKMDLKK